MSTLRYDATTNDWVIFAPSRARRPGEYCVRDSRQSDPHPQSCPFCPGNERLTPPEIDAVRPGTERNAGDWRVRVVPNLFPALQIEENPESRTEANALFRYRGGCGAHEVVIESPRHNLALHEQPLEQVVLLLQMLQRRYNDLLRDPRFQAILIFKNHGERAGTTLRHPHCQLIATPVVPRLNRLKVTVAEEYYDRTGHGLYTRLLEQELAEQTRVLAVNQNYAAVLPYASHVPFETWILPLHQQATFGAVPGALLPDLAAILRLVLRALYRGLDDPDFNLMVDTAPRGDEGKPWFLWHIQILPRLAPRSGFELGSGMPINTVLPEEAAAFLREIVETEDWPA